MRYLVLITFSWPPVELEAGSYLFTTAEAAAPYLVAGWIKAA